MDSGYVLTILWQQAGWVLPAALLIGGVKLSILPRLQGALGEWAVRTRLKGLATDEIHDCFLPDGRGGMTQIDHLYLTGSGIRVVETKNFGGRIFGAVGPKTWTQRFGRRSIQIRNPLRQNWAHIQAVRAIVGGQISVHGHVVIGGRAEFPKGVPEGVQRPRALANTIRHDCTDTVPKPEWQSAWSRLKASARSDTAARRTHRAQLARNHGSDKTNAVGMTMLGTGLAVGAVYFLSIQGI